MLSNQDWQEEDDELENNLSRFEDMLSSDASYFFDADELEELFDYYLDYNDKSKAMQVVKYGIKLHPDSSPLQLKYAQALLASHKPTQALEMMQTIQYAEFPFDFYALKSKIFFQLGQSEKAIDCLNEARKYAQGRDDLEDVYMGLAYNFKETKDWKKAKYFFKEALKINFENESALYELSWIYQDEGKALRFVGWLNGFLDEHPFSEQAWLILGQTYEVLGNTKEALNSLEFAISVKNDFISAYIEKAEILFDEDQYKEALETYREIQKFQEDSSLFCAMGNCYLSMKDYIQALKQFKKANQIDDSDVDAWLGLSESYENLDELQAAHFYIKKCLAEDNSNAYYQFCYGVILKKMSFLDEAEQIFLQLIKSAPDDEDTALEIADLYFLLKETERALNFCKEFVENNPEAHKIRYRLVAYLLILGKENEAESQLYIAHAQNKDGLMDLFGYLPEEYFTEHIIETIVDFEENNEF